MKIDKSKAGQIYGTPGVMWKVDGVRYNARWEEMEFVSVGENEGDSDIYRLKKKVDQLPIIVPEKVEEVVESEINNVDQTETGKEYGQGVLEAMECDWSMKKSDIKKSLITLGVAFEEHSRKSVLYALLKNALDR